MACDNPGVHVTHCCIHHGCKYRDNDCPVASGEMKQKYPCEECAEELVEARGMRLDLLLAEMERRGYRCELREEPSR